MYVGIGAVNMCMWVLVALTCVCGYRGGINMCMWVVVVLACVCG